MRVTEHTTSFVTKVTEVDKAATWGMEGKKKILKSPQLTKAVGLLRVFHPITGIHNIQAILEYYSSHNITSHARILFLSD